MVADGVPRAVAQDTLNRARAGLSPGCYARAVRFRAESALLSWPECVAAAQLFEPVQKPAAPAR
jgi:hypothetical protein